MKQQFFKEIAKRIAANPSESTTLFSNREMCIKVIKKMLTLICKCQPNGAELMDGSNLKIDDMGNVTKHQYIANKSENYPLEELIPFNLEMLFADLYTSWQMFQIEFLLIIFDELKK